VALSGLLLTERTAIKEGRYDTLTLVDLDLDALTAIVPPRGYGRD
jgi:hypothetical protein